jgi:hypothetical protein
MSVTRCGGNAAMIIEVVVAEENAGLAMPVPTAVIAVTCC